jgi:hypothetical protein
MPPAGFETAIPAIQRPLAHALDRYGHWDKYVSKSSPVTGLEWPRGFQEVKVPRFHDNGTGWW